MEYQPQNFNFSDSTNNSCKGFFYLFMAGEITRLVNLCPMLSLKHDPGTPTIQILFAT